MKRRIRTVLLLSTLLALPLSFLSLSAIYMPQPIRLLAQFVLVPLLLLDRISPADPARTPSQAVVWATTIVGQLVWFWFLGLLFLGLWTLLVRSRNARGAA
jgi:hypothetical protein